MLFQGTYGRLSRGVVCLLQRFLVVHFTNYDPISFVELVRELIALQIFSDSECIKTFPMTNFTLRINEHGIIYFFKYIAQLVDSLFIG
jgi:hypothetical protein